MRLALTGLLFAGVLFDGAPSGEGARRKGAPVDARSQRSVQLTTYMVSCALGEGESLTLPVADETRSFEGRFGLAKTWWSGHVSLEDQRWMTACLLARTNLFGRKVLVSLRGAHPNLRTGAGTPEPRSIEEGAFYGNLFAEAERAYACLGAREPANSPELASRVCAEQEGSSSRTRCGFVYAGRCSDVCELDPSGSFHRRCSGGGRLYDEVITVHLPRASE